MLFDQVCELPVATVRRAPHSTTYRLLGDLQRWLAARWSWLRPRTVPVAVAFVGMLGVLEAVSYLSTPPEGAASGAVSGAPSIEAPAGTLMYIDGQPYRDGAPLGELPTTGYRVRLVLQR